MQTGVVVSMSRRFFGERPAEKYGAFSVPPYICVVNAYLVNLTPVIFRIVHAYVDIGALEMRKS